MLNCVRYFTSVYEISEQNTQDKCAPGKHEEKRGSNITDSSLFYIVAVIEEKGTKLLVNALQMIGPARETECL